MSKNPPPSEPGVARSIGTLLPKRLVSDPQLGGRFLACLKIHRQASQALRETLERFFQSGPPAVGSLSVEMQPMHFCNVWLATSGRHLGSQCTFAMFGRLHLEDI